MISGRDGRAGVARPKRTLEIATGETAADTKRVPLLHMKKIVILGSTGSIGESALRVAQALPRRLRIVGLSTRHNYRKLLAQAERFGVRTIAVADREAALACRKKLPRGMRLFEGDEGIARLASLSSSDMVLCSVVGIAGLAPVMSAISSGKDVALATKEVLVAAGSIVMKAAARHKVHILPVDSEHSAVFQCIGTQGASPWKAVKAGVRRIVLTASGGAFGSKPDVDFNRVTVSETLKHPRWNMGKKVTVDSATLMNKGLEVMEAHWLFGVPLEAIDVVIHPESIVHSAVEFVDGSVVAQLSLPDMRFAIQYAFTWPERVDGNLPRLDLAGLGALNFRPPDERRFPCLRLARTAARFGGTMPAILNAANEEAVQGFLDGSMPFSGIWRIVEAVMKRSDAVKNPSLDEIVQADLLARRDAVRQIGKQ